MTWYLASRRATALGLVSLVVVLLASAAGGIVELPAVLGGGSSVLPWTALLPLASAIVLGWAFRSRLTHHAQTAARPIFVFDAILLASVGLCSLAALSLSGSASLMTGRNLLLCLGLVGAALEFSDKDAGDVAVRLDQLVTVPPEATPADVERLVARHGYSRYPTCDDDGEITGYLHLKDVLYADDEDRAEPVPRKRVRRLASVRAGDEVEEVLATMQRTGAHLAQVTDADGAVLGVVFLEDVIEELVGEVADPVVRTRVLRWLLERPEVLSVSYLHLEYVGPEKLFVVGAVDLAGDERESEAAVLLQRVEDALLEHPRVAAVVLSLSNPAHAPLAPESQNTRV
mgnify:CR=1 FL=1